MLQIACTKPPSLPLTSPLFFILKIHMDDLFRLYGGLVKNDAYGYLKKLAVFTVIQWPLLESLFWLITSYRNPTSKGSILISNA